MTAWEMKTSHGFLNTGLPFVFQSLIFFAVLKQIGDRNGGRFLNVKVTSDIKHRGIKEVSGMSFLQAKYAFLRPTDCAVHTRCVCVGGGSTLADLPFSPLFFVWEGVGINTSPCAPLVKFEPLMHYCEVPQA